MARDYQVTAYESAAMAIDEAHKRTARTDPAQPMAIWRRKLPHKLSHSAAPYRYTVGSAWEPAPKDAGALVMIVSVSGIERLEGPWEANAKEFAEALKG